jgi:hypothetical protein
MTKSMAEELQEHNVTVELKMLCDAGTLRGPKGPKPAPVQNQLQSPELQAVLAKLGFQLVGLGRARIGASRETLRKALLVVMQRMTQSDLVFAIPVMYRTCTSWQSALVGEGFCIRTFKLCRVLADSDSAKTLQRLRATIER